MAMTLGATAAYGSGATGDAYFGRGRTLADANDPRSLPLLAVSVTLAHKDVARQIYFLSHLDRTVPSGDVITLSALNRIAPHYVPLLGRLGRALEQNGRTAEAESVYLRWARMRPGQGEPLARLGDLYLFAGQWHKAMNVYTRLRDLKGQDEYASRRMQEIRQRANQPATAQAQNPGRDPDRAPPSADMAMARTGNAQ